jgi:hypothetical protein
MAELTIMNSCTEMQQNLSFTNVLLSLVEWRKSVYRFIIYVSSSILYCSVSLQIQVDNFELVTGLFPYDLYKDDLPIGEQIVVSHSLLSIIDRFQSIVYCFIYIKIYMIQTLCSLLSWAKEECSLLDSI